MWKESLNSDGQQFNQYQQNEQSPLTSNHWTHKKTITYVDINQAPDLKTGTQMYPGLLKYRDCKATLNWSKMIVYCINYLGYNKVGFYNMMFLVRLVLLILC